MYGINVAERIADISYDEYVRFIKHLFHTWYYHLKKRTIHNLNSYFVSPAQVFWLSSASRLSLETNHHQSTFSHPFEGSAPHISPPTVTTKHIQYVGAPPSNFVSSNSTRVLGQAQQWWKYFSRKLISSCMWKWHSSQIAANVSS